MGQRPSEELRLVAARIPALVSKRLQEMADAEGRATSSLARAIIENFFYIGLPPQMRTELEQDEKRLGLNRRDYINHLLFDPRKAAAARTTLRQVLEMLVEHRWSEAKAGKRAPETAQFYAKKAGVLLRLFGVDFRLAQLDAPAVDAYVRARREEGTSDHTIHKELTTLRASLRIALRARLWSGSLDEVLPERFGAGYRPRDRALTPDELASLLGQLTAAKAAPCAHGRHVRQLARMHARAARGHRSAVRLGPPARHQAPDAGPGTGASWSRTLH